VRLSGAAELGLTDRSDIARAISEITVNIDSKALLKPPVITFMPSLPPRKIGAPHLKILKIVDLEHFDGVSRWNFTGKLVLKSPRIILTRFYVCWKILRDLPVNQR